MYTYVITNASYKKVCVWQKSNTAMVFLTLYWNIVYDLPVK